jgi:hypothetical protein
MLTKSKEEIAWAARDAAIRAIKSHASVGYNQNSTSVMGQLTELIALAVQAGVAEVLNNLYTNEEFEKDIGL